MELRLPSIESTLQRPSINFGIKDERVIFDILCNKLYSRPLFTSVQEYISNARDANIEAGRDHLPVDIYLPTQLSNQIRIRDYGLGLSEERIHNIFVFLGESSKRQSDDQVGMFGIGAKSAWSYTNNFTITTWTGTYKYVYLAFIDSDNFPKLTLLSKERDAVTHPGTEISIPILEKDIPELRRFISDFVNLSDFKLRCINMQVTPIQRYNVDDYVCIVKGLRHYNRGSLLLNYNGVPYEYPASKITFDVRNILESGLSWDSVMYIRVLPEEARVSVSREELILSKGSFKSIHERLEWAMELLAQQYFRAQRQKRRTYVRLPDFNGLPLKVFNIGLQVSLHSTYLTGNHYTYVVARENPTKLSYITSKGNARSIYIHPSTIFCKCSKDVRSYRSILLHLFAEKRVAKFVISDEAELLAKIFECEYLDLDLLQEEVFLVDDILNVSTFVLTKDSDLTNVVYCNQRDVKDLKELLYSLPSDTQQRIMKHFKVIKLTKKLQKKFPTIPYFAPKLLDFILTTLKMDIRDWNTQVVRRYCPYQYYTAIKQMKKLNQLKDLYLNQFLQPASLGYGTRSTISVLFNFIHLSKKVRREYRKIEILVKRFTQEGQRFMDIQKKYPLMSVILNYVEEINDELARELLIYKEAKDSQEV